MGDIDRDRAERLMQEADLDGLLLFQPEAFRYAIGASAGVATMWGRAGAAIAFVPADAGLALAAVVSDHALPSIRKSAPDVELRSHRIWIDTVDTTDAGSIAQIDQCYRRGGSTGERPETFDREASFCLLGELLRERGLSEARLGVDMEFMPAADFAALKHHLPRALLTDGSAVLRRLRSVKTPVEIARLRLAANAAEAGIVRMVEAIRTGSSVQSLSDAWKSGAKAFAIGKGVSLSGSWDYISVGPDLSDANATVVPGALIKADVGTLVEGYSSDSARTFVYGEASPLANDLDKILLEAFEAGLEHIRPGNTFGAVHRVVTAAIRRGGLSEYHRGHFGHSVGGSAGIEEWPFFSMGNEELIQPGMVVALETPFYGNGFGALMIEDQFLVTSDGTECMNRLPRGLQKIMH
ncbi:proline dipeptidase [Rhizobium sp. Leaf321]|uniref:M24 family metallopeptidase n=1 Tax=Rhizobium sp. Leaf321 TaxID=1736335 RepID=UPI0007161DB4|nr:Xaa-Pro peptidase family protein [Rhizobium sp. Leaf321]KQQ75056.1 proline dipeptidase [Rhizobium sp. Leaf321]